jgi:acetylornithine/succinyldiaminopimelate/putrescine aminotransferase
VNRTDEKVVRLLPPLNIAVADIDQAIETLGAVLASVRLEVQV